MHGEAHRPRSASDRRDRRSARLASDVVVPVRLTRKLADTIDGVDISNCTIGQRVVFAAAEARLLILEGWAEPAQRRRDDTPLRGAFGSVSATSTGSSGF